jgi:hypothetical protein
MKDFLEGHFGRKRIGFLKIVSIGQLQVCSDSLNEK